MSIKGKVMIRVGSEYGEPEIVYVSHLNTDLDLWVTPKINSGIVNLSKENQLIEFDWAVFNKMYYQWKIDNLPNIKKRMEELLAEWN